MNFFRSILVWVFVVLTSNTFGQPSDLTIKVMDNLGIHLEDCEGSLFAEKVLPYDKNLTVIVIPKIGQHKEGMFTLDSYVVVVNNKTERIKHKYFESYKTSGWESDAVFISDLTIDTARYLVQENTRAFGVILHTRNMSHPNPYASNYISLFIPKGNKLQNILKNFEIYSYGGETDMECLAELYYQRKILILSNNITNGFFDIEVKVSNTIHISKGEDCEATKTSSNAKQVLKFSDGTYKIQKQ